VDRSAAGGPAIVTTLVAVLAAVVAVAAAVRSTWSPCGLSVLSSITPVGERSRGHRYRVTAGWFVAGAVAGGATLGMVTAGLTWVVSPAHLDSHPAWLAGAVAVVAGAAAAVDAGVFGPVIPVWRRQLNDAWMARYRGWVYGAGYGWQLGVGFATYIMTAAVFALPVLGVLTGSAAEAFALGALFGLVRGFVVLLTARAASPAQLRALHRRFADLGPAVRVAVIGVELAVVVAVLAGQWSLAGGAVALAAVVIVVTLGLVGARPAVSARRRVSAGSP
jgi:hypothetical protein